MRRIFHALALISGLTASPVLAGDAEIKSAQGAIEGQLRAFQSSGAIWQVQADIDGDGDADLNFFVTTDHDIVVTDFALAPPDTADLAAWHHGREHKPLEAVLDQKQVGVALALDSRGDLRQRLLPVTFDQPRPQLSRRIQILGWLAPVTTATLPFRI